MALVVNRSLIDEMVTGGVFLTNGYIAEKFNGKKQKILQKSKKGTLKKKFKKI